MKIYQNFQIGKLDYIKERIHQNDLGTISSLRYLKSVMFHHCLIITKAELHVFPVPLSLKLLASLTILSFYSKHSVEFSAE